MTTALETAFPAGSNWVRDTVVAKLAEAFIPVFATPDLSAEDFTGQPYGAIAVGGPDGDLEFYSYDALDTTTADDGGVSCIVVSGRRYKKRINVIVKDSALSATTSAQPASPSLGDAYIVPASPSGDDWASQAKTVATYTARGWIFRQPFVGMVVYVEDTADFYHYAADGNWTQGMGSGALPDGSVTPMKLKLPFGLIKVEGTQNSPPGGTPTVGTAYQVGTSGSGAWSGHSNKVARWSEAGAWEFYTPTQGDHIVRKDIGPDTLYKWSGGAWIRAVSAPIVVQTYYADDNTVSTSSGSITNRISSPSITASVGQKIRVICQVTAFSNTTSTGRFGIRVDSSGSFSKELYSVAGAVTNGQVTLVGEIAVPDASAHIYHIATTSGGSVSAVTSRAVFEVIQPT